MKKSKSVVALMVAAALSFGTAAVAIAAPTLFTASKTTGDLYTATTSDPSVALNPDTQSAEYQKAVDEASKVVDAMKASEDAEAYFTANGGAEVVSSIEAIVGQDGFVVNEVGPFVVTGWTEDKGAVQFTMEFPTKYAENEKVAFCIGIVNADGTITWKVIEGVADKDGKIQFEVDVDTLKLVEANTAVYAVAQAA